mgnify:CR=1 FL=1
MEKQIYSNYAFTENEGKKFENNRAIYRKLDQKYLIYKNNLKFDLVNCIDCDFENYDIVIGGNPERGQTLYRIHKNAPNLTVAELALICDRGKLIFGYSYRGNDILVWEC